MLVVDCAGTVCVDVIITTATIAMAARDYQLMRIGIQKTTEYTRMSMFLQVST